MDTQSIKRGSPVTAPQLRRQAAKYDYEDVLMMSNPDIEPSRDEHAAVGDWDQSHFNMPAPHLHFSPGGPPIVASQGLGWPNFIDYPHELQPPVATQTSSYMPIGNGYSVGQDEEAAESGIRMIELRRKNRELRRVLGETKNEYEKSQLKTMRSNQAIRVEVDLLSETVEEAMQITNRLGEVYTYLKLLRFIEDRADKIRDIIT